MSLRVSNLVFFLAFVQKLFNLIYDMMGYTLDFLNSCLFFLFFLLRFSIAYFLKYILLTVQRNITFCFLYFQLHNFMSSVFVTELYIILWWSKLSHFSFRIDNYILKIISHQFGVESVKSFNLYLLFLISWINFYLKNTSFNHHKRVYPCSCLFIPGFSVCCMWNFLEGRNL